MWVEFTIKDDLHRHNVCENFIGHFLPLYLNAGWEKVTYEISAMRITFYRIDPARLTKK